MNRLLLSCLLLMSILFARQAQSQNFAVWLSPGGQDLTECYNPNGNSGVGAVVTLTNIAYNAQEWYVFAPNSCTTAPSFTCTSVDCRTVNIDYACCGTYTVIVAAINTTINAPNTLTVTTDTAYATIICPNTATATPSASAICLGDQVTIVGNGAQTYNWFTSSGQSSINANPVTFSPTSITTITMTGTTSIAQGGCTVFATTTVGVQQATVSVTPAAQTICLGSQICFTANAGPVSNSSVTPGTTTTGIQWFDPNNNSFGTGYTACTPAIAGNYSAVALHQGAAGTCTAAAISAVTISNSITVSAGSHSPNVCPNANVTLTAVSMQTAGASYTWTAPGGQTLTGNPVVFQPSVATCYTVDVDYFGCPGQNTVCVGMASLTPTVTANSNSICPGTSVTLTGSGGATYSFYYVHPGPNPVLIGTPSTAVNNVAHSPTLNPMFPATYSMAAFSGGCSGSAVINIFGYSLSPTFGATTPSVCPSSTVTFTAGNVGAGANYTIYAPYPTNPTSIYAGPNSSHTHVPSPFSPPQTYTLWADSAGCTGSANFQLGLLALTPTITPSSASICPGTQFTMEASGGAGTTYTFYAAPANQIPNPGDTYSVTYTPTLNLPQTYTVQADSASCVGTATIEIGELNLNSVLTVSAAPGISVCPETTFTLTANMGAGTSYTFDAPTGTQLPMQGSNSASHSLTASQLALNGTYTVTADSAGCKGTETITISRKILNPVLSVSPPTVCAGIDVVLNASGGNGTSFTFLRPDPGNFPPVQPVGTPSSAANSATHSPGPTVNTTYTVFVDSLQCQGTGTAQVIIAPGLIVSGTASSPTVCSGQSATLSAIGPTNASYSWTQITGTNAPVPVAGGTSLNYSTVSQGIPVNPTVNTQYVITGIDPNGCRGTDTVYININPTASLSISLSPKNSTICPGQSATLTASGTTSYSWIPGNNLQPSSTVPTVVATPSATTIYTVVGTNNLGCYGTSTLQLVVGQWPILSISPSAYSVCPGFNSTLTAFGAISYTWTGTTASVPNTFTTPILQQSVAVGPGSYTVQGSNGGTCIRDTLISIGTATNLTINVAKSSNTTCIASNYPKFSHPVTFTASGAANYVWQPYNPAYMTYSLGPITTVRPPASTCYTVTGYNSVCSGTAVSCVTVIPQFTMNVVPPLPAMCLGDSVKLSITNVSTLAVGPPSAFSYSWTEAENAPPISISDYLEPVVTVFPQNTTTYSVEVRDSRACVSLPRLVTVTVFPRPITAVSTPTINNVPTNTVCFVGVHTGPPDVLITLTAENKNGSLPFGVVPTYTWLQPYKPPVNSILTPANNNEVTVNAPMRLPTVAVYTVISGYNGVPGCAVQNTIDIRVVDCRPVSSVTAPIWVMAEPVDTICAQECVTFVSLTDSMAGGPQTYTWTFEGGSPGTSNEKNPTVCYNLPNPNGYNVILRVSNPYPIADGGSSRVIGVLREVKVVDVPNVSIIDPGNRRSDTTVRFGTPVELKAKGGLTYQWSPNYNISSLTGTSVVVKPYRTTQYILTGYNSKSCFSRDTIDVIVIEDCGEMFVPNAFSPNGDGHNDVLKVNGICLETMSFMIFNRWGQKVFETNQQSVGWDGTFNGEPMNTGVFVYRLEGRTYDGKAYSSKGNITLIR